MTEQQYSQQLESEIKKARTELLRARTRVARKAAADKLAELTRQRTLEQVERMEKKAGLV